MVVPRTDDSSMKNVFERHDIKPGDLVWTYNTVVLYDSVAEGIATKASDLHFMRPWVPHIIITIIPAKTTSMCTWLLVIDEHGRPGWTHDEYALWRVDLYRGK